ncbi:efflux RND transporter permease subunit [Thermosulfurimonas marina]|uniref:Efflux RND transporter permease subunit n=1 Tax=Thermosulfurimonas marina TaxID=2047767 RepID=A0A6H1WSS0_9BACT|nr:efflux RND transporter permease subunit [Thermosulfurimonas marina]
MNVVEWMQSHRRSILFLIAILALGGLAASFRLPVALFPHVDFPRVEVKLEAGDRPAERMAIEVTRPVEEAIRSVPGVRSIRSTTSRGSADISINFDWGEDMVAAMLQVESAINQVLPRLPRGTSFTVRRMDPTVFPVLAYSLTSDTHSLVELRDLALYQLRPLVSTVKGVAKVGVQGGAEEEYEVMIDPAKLDALGLSIDDVARALSAANVIKAVGRLEDHYKLYLVISDTRFQSLKEIKETIIRAGKNGLVRLDDIATVRRGTAPQWIRVTADGHDAVLLLIYQQPRGNTVEIAKEVKKKLAEFRKHLPLGIKIAKWYDQSELILSAAGSVRDAVLIGLLFAALVLWLFLRNLKMTFIAAVLVPSVLAATIILLYVLHMSFNIMTLGGLAAAVGLIIDDMIVMEEHIVRRLGELANQELGIATAVRELSRPLAGSSASTTIIFAPLAFLSGVTGAFFKALSLTMAASLLISFFVAWLGVPILANHLLTQKDAEKERPGRWASWFYERYESFMKRIMARPWLIIPVLLILVGIGWIAYHRLGSGFMPKMDEGGFVLDYRAPSGTSLTETDRLLRQVEMILQETPDVETYSRRTGLSLGGHITEANEGDFFVRLKPPPRRDIEAVMEDIRGRIERRVPGLEIEMAQLMEDLIGDLTAVPQPIEIKLFSDNGTLLRKLAPKVAEEIRKISGVVDVRDGIVLAGDALVIHVDRDRAALEGVDPEWVTRMLSYYLGGTVTTQIQKTPKMVGVRVWIPSHLRDTASKVEALRLRAPDGHFFPLRRIARVEVLTGQPQIMHEDLKRMVAVTGRISGRDMGSVIRDVKRVLNRPGLIPKGVYYELGGLYRQQQIAFAGLLAVFVSAVLLVFLLLLFLYESFRMAIAVMATTLLSLAGVFVGLWITHTEINISSMMGLTMIVGIVTETAIFYLSEYRLLPRHVPYKTALILAGRNRLRAVAMTTVAAILALMPLALGIGQGAAMLKPLAIAIISGLCLQLPLVLVVLPALLALIKREYPTG